MSFGPEANIIRDDAKSLIVSRTVLQREKHSEQTVMDRAKRKKLAPISSLDAAVVTGVELKNHLLVVVSIDAASDGQNACGLARAGRSVKEKVRQAILVDELVHCRWCVGAMS